MSINLSNQSCFDFLPTVEKNSIDLILRDNYSVSQIRQFSTTDKTSLKYKKEIQHLFHMKYFPKFDMDGTIKGQPTVGKVNSVLKELKKKNKT